jgi:ABC-type transporter Mla subunit MlaD
MVDEDFKLYNVLMDTILPNLNRIQASQNEQRLQTDRLSQNLEEFRKEMAARFADLNAELAATLHQVEVAMANLRESEARVAALLGSGKNQIVH